MGWKERVLARLAELNMTKQRLAEVTGLSPSYIYKLLMQGAGRRENPSREVLERLARALALPLGVLDTALPLGEYLLERLHALPATEKAALRHQTPAQRFRLIYDFLRQDPRWHDEAERVAALRLAPQTVRALLEGTDPDAGLVRHLAEQTGLSVRWWIRGRLDPHPALVARVLEHDEAQGYLEVMAEAIEAGISSQTLREIVAAITRVGH